jgi:2-polyprenyl-3-methyl-5-hydroxy-6-metoxy-1,4-benzoquinol methylase
VRDEKLFFYDGISDRFDAISNMYDTRRRLEIVFDELLADEDLSGRSVLDVGCGTGWFSQRAAARGARVTSLDIGVRLLAEARRKCSMHPVAADACLLPFADATFDVVVSSECIEHTLDPERALREILRVARPNGPVVVTVPNQLWHFSATIAAVFKLRPYEGYEHWMRWRDVRRVVRDAGARIETMRGFHLVPPLFRPLQPALRRLDALGGSLGPLMLNIALRARR